MTVEIGIVLGVIILAMYLFISEKFGIDTVAIIIMAILMITGVLTPAEGFAGFTNSATITVACMFVVSSAIYKSGSLRKVGNLLRVISRKSYVLTIGALMIISGGLSAFMNDTAVVALLMPVVIKVAKKTKLNPSMLLMPLSFGALLGGICTLIGTSTNILVSGIAEAQGLPPIGMFEMAPVGLIFLAVGITYMVVFGKKILPNREQKGGLAEEYAIGQYLTEIILLPQAKSVGKSIKESPLEKLLGIKIIQITRKGSLLYPFPGFILEADDILKVSCDINKLKRLMYREGIKLKSDKRVDVNELLTGDITLVEAMVTVNSKMEDRSLKAFNFRARFSGATVLAVRHREEIVHEKVGHTKLKSGDVLLIYCNNDQLPLLKNSDDMLIISENVHSRFNVMKAISVIGIVGGIVAFAALGIAPIVLSATVGVIVLIIFKFIKTEEAYRAIDWKVVFMLAGILSLGAALEKTGTAGLIADGIINTIGQYGPQAVLSVFFGLTFLSTNFMSNNATAALLAPIAIVTANDMDINSRPFLLAVTFAASLSFMTPMGYQTNAMIYAPGNYKFKDYLRVGTPLNILFWILATFIIPYFFPF